MIGKIENEIASCLPASEMILTMYFNKIFKVHKINKKKLSL